MDSIKKPANAKLNTYMATIPVGVAMPTEDELQQQDARFIFTSDTNGETMTMLIGGLTISFPYEATQQLITHTRQQRKDIC